MNCESAIPLIRTNSTLRSLRSSLAQPVSLVPTMGLLHAGHLSLIRIAASQSTSIIVSIFANPTQLVAEGGSPTSYSSDLPSDIAILTCFNEGELRKSGKRGSIAAIFAPPYEEMYPNAENPAFITIPPLHEKLEGFGRPSHFKGVATICLKLLVLASPDVAIFGEKDYQQLILLKRLVAEFLLHTEIISGPVIRDQENGLALSSRNALLSQKQREVATVLWRSLKAGAAAYYDEKRCMRDKVLRRCAVVVQAEEKAQREKGAEGVRFETLYFEVVDKETLDGMDTVDPKKGAFLTGAINMLPLEGVLSDYDEGNSTVRLIDGIVLEPIIKC